MFSDKPCEIKCVFPYVVGIRIMSIHISCDMYLRLGLHVQIRLYYVLPYKAKISDQHWIGFILDRCIVYLGLIMPNLQKKCLQIFEIFNIEKCTLFFGTEYSLCLYEATFSLLCCIASFCSDLVEYLPWDLEVLGSNPALIRYI